MRVSVLQGNLAGGLAVVSRAVASRSTLPVLSNILLATDMGRLRLAATNLEMGVSCWVRARVEEDGSITVPARVLLDLVNGLPPERIDMELIARTSTLHLQCARFEAHIKGIDAQEFPLIPTLQRQEDETEESVPWAALDNMAGLDADTLGMMIEQVAFSAAADESRPILTGVLMHFAHEGTGKQLTMAAADGFRLSVRREALQVESSGEESAGDGVQDVIVPARALTELARVSRTSESRGSGGADGGGNQEPIVLSVTSERNQILFHQGNVDLVSQLIEGHFPDYTQIIPKTYALRTVVDTADLLKAVRMANIFARDAANIVRLTVAPGSELAPGHVAVTATSAELGDHVGEVDAVVEQAPDQEGESLTIAFNANYLIDALSCIDEEKVALETTTPSSPAVIKPVQGPDLVHVIMPIQISG